MESGKCYKDQGLLFVKEVPSFRLVTWMEKEPQNDEEIVKELDRKYQLAVKENDHKTMDEILSDEFVLITGMGKVYTKDDLLSEAKNGTVKYDIQEDVDQSVRIMNDTAVITAKLKASGVEDGSSFSYQLWFSDTYVRTPEGWKYFIGQASTRIPL